MQVVTEESLATFANAAAFIESLGDPDSKELDDCVEAMTEREIVCIEKGVMGIPAREALRVNPYNPRAVLAVLWLLTEEEVNNGMEPEPDRMETIARLVLLQAQRSIPRTAFDWFVARDELYRKMGDSGLWQQIERMAQVEMDSPLLSDEATYRVRATDLSGSQHTAMWLAVAQARQCKFDAARATLSTPQADRYRPNLLEVERSILALAGQPFALSGNRVVVAMDEYIQSDELITQILKTMEAAKSAGPNLILFADYDNHAEENSMRVAWLSQLLMMVPALFAQFDLLACEFGEDADEDEDEDEDDRAMSGHLRFLEQTFIQELKASADDSEQHRHAVHANAGKVTRDYPAITASDVEPPLMWHPHLR